MFYSCRLNGGNTTIIEAKNINQAKKYARQYFGNIMSPRVEYASEEDVSWVKAMGGYIHKA